MDFDGVSTVASIATADGINRRAKSKADYEKMEVPNTTSDDITNTCLSYVLDRQFVCTAYCEQLGGAKRYDSKNDNCNICCCIAAVSIFPELIIHTGINSLTIYLYS